jgi:hypothetical protein
VAEILAAICVIAAVDVTKSCERPTLYQRHVRVLPTYLVFSFNATIDTSANLFKKTYYFRVCHWRPSFGPSPDFAHDHHYREHHALELAELSSVQVGIHTVTTVLYVYYST